MLCREAQEQTGGGEQRDDPGFVVTIEDVKHLLVSQYHAGQVLADFLFG